MLQLILAFLNGKKTLLGIAGLIILKGVEAVYTGLINPEIGNVIENALLLLTGGGISHKIVKNNEKN